MNSSDVLNNLQKRNNLLKSKLIHQQLKYGNYTSHYFKKYSALVINEYKYCNSLFKASLILGIDSKEVINWYIQGQQKNSKFRGFYLAITELNNDSIEDEIIDDKLAENEFTISRYGDGWSYKTFIDGKKVFLISDDLENLKMKVKSKKLPLD